MLTYNGFTSIARKARRTKCNCFYLLLPKFFKEKRKRSHLNSKMDNEFCSIAQSNEPPPPFISSFILLNNSDLGQYTQNHPYNKKKNAMISRRSRGTRTGKDQRNQSILYTVLIICWPLQSYWQSYCLVLLVCDVFVGWKKGSGIFYFLPRSLFLGRFFLTCIDWYRTRQTGKKTNTQNTKSRCH